MDVDKYLTSRLTVVAKGASDSSEASSASSDYNAVAQFLSSDDSFELYDFVVADSVLSYPFSISLFCNQTGLGELLVNKSSDLNDLGEWLLVASVPTYFTTSAGSISYDVIQYAGDRELPLLLLRSDVSEAEIAALPGKFVTVKNLNFLEDPFDRATLISFTGGWRAATNSTAISAWVTEDHEQTLDLYLVVLALALIFPVRLLFLSKRVQWLLSRITAMFAVILSLKLSQGGCACSCAGCGCS